MNFSFPFLGPRAKRQVHRPAPAADELPPPAGVLTTDFLPNAKKRYAEISVKPFLASARASTLAAAALLIAILEGVALVRLIPLHEKVPYMATFDENGRLAPDERYRPVRIENVQQGQIGASLKRFARYMFTIDSQMKLNFPKTALWVRGAAVNELIEWLEKTDRPFERQAKEPTLTREIAGLAVTYGSGKTAFLHLELVERTGGTEIKRYKKLLQIEYDTLSDQVNEDNPLGVVAAHFSVGDE